MCPLTLYKFYLNGFESFSDQLIILTGELLEIGIVELGVGIALGTNVPENVLLIKKSSRGNKSKYLLLNTLCLSLQDPNAPSMKPVLAILTANVKPKQNAFLSLGNICSGVNLLRIIVGLATHAIDLLTVLG